MAANRPDTWFGVALNRDPNDPNTSPVWNDFTSNLRKVSGLVRGRDFELDQPMASEPQLLIRDVDELLNPANTSSPHVNLIQPYREACLLAQWPNTPAGGAVNLFNAGAWRGNKVDPLDGSFDSFPAGGPKPNWAFTVGSAANFVIDAGTPFQGVRDLAYTVPSSTAQSGFSWPVACIPGRQYTCSVYVRQTTASTQRISVSDQVLSADPFNTTAVNSWGTDRLGLVWTPLVGAATVFARANLLASIAPEALAADRIITVDTGALDHSTTVRLIAPDPATVGDVAATSGVAVRVSDSSNYITPVVVWRADGTVGVATFKRVAGVRSTVVAETATGWNYSAGQEFVLRVDTQTLGTTANVNSLVWPTIKPRPVNYHNVGTATDAVLLTGTRAGGFARIESTTGVTLPYTMRFAAFNCVGYVHGSTSAATGAYNRVSVTFTATQPQHRVQLATTGTAVAGVVLADAIQHEQAAAASAYTTAGPVIYPVMRNLVEQWPRTWESAGFEGYVDAPCVDGLAVLQTISIQPEYAQAVLNTGPDYYYRLNDGTETGVFADTSGNGQLPLTRYISKFGPGTDIEPGTQAAFPGNPGGTGVAVTAVNAGIAFSRPGTALFLGGNQNSPSAVFPSAVRAVGVGAWAMTFACMANLTTNPSGDGQALFCFTQPGAGPRPSIILYVQPTQVLLTYTSLTTGANNTLLTSSVINSGSWHHIVGQIVSDGTNSAINIWLDGVFDTASFATGAMPVGTLRQVTVGCDAQGQISQFANGVISDAAIWNRALTDAEVQTLASAALFAYNGETSGGRILRRLTDNSRYTGATRITQAGATTPQTVLQAPSWAGVKDVLSDQLETSNAEQGTSWAAADGAIVAESRQDRWLRLTPSFVLGEDTGAGEVPYLMDGARFVPDPLYVYANVQIGRINGVTAQGGKAGDIATAARRYFPRGSVATSFDFFTDDLAQSMANYVFYTHNAPVMRVSEITVDPSSNPVLWPFVLGLEIGRRGTVRRRPKAANAGVGITMSADYFVEKISVDTIDFDTGEWMYRVQFSPINAGGTPSFQPWIVGDPTYGVVGVTTIPGW